MAFEELLDSMEQKSKRNIPVTGEDYLDDEGLMMCGKCHTRKQTTVRFPDGKIRKPYCLCKCASENLKKTAERIKNQDTVRKIKEMRNLGDADERTINSTFEKDDNSNSSLTSVAKRYVENFPEMLKRGAGLIFYGGVGTGKTFISACIANALINRMHPCLVTNFSRIANTLFGLKEGKQDYLDNLNKFDLLVIDDLAAERDTEYMNEIVYNIADSRYRNKKPLIITTNLTKDELENPTDIKRQRIFGRLREICTLVEVKGVDRRKRNATYNFFEVRKLLGI